MQSFVFFVRFDKGNFCPLFLKGEERILFCFFERKHHLLAIFFVRFVTRCSVVFLEGGLVWHFARWIGIFWAFFEPLDGGIFRTDAVDLFLPLFFRQKSRDDDEVAYLVYVVRNYEVGRQQKQKFSHLLPHLLRPHHLP